MNSKNKAWFKARYASKYPESSARLLRRAARAKWGVRGDIVTWVGSRGEPSSLYWAVNETEKENRRTFSTALDLAGFFMYHWPRHRPELKRFFRRCLKNSSRYSPYQVISLCNAIRTSGDRHLIRETERFSKHSSPKVRHWVALIISKAPGFNKEKILGELCEDKSAYVRDAVAFVLANSIQPDSKYIREKLLQLCKSSRGIEKAGSNLLIALVKRGHEPAARELERRLAVPNNKSFLADIEAYLSWWSSPRTLLREIRSNQKILSRAKNNLRKDGLLRYKVAKQIDSIQKENRKYAKELLRSPKRRYAA